MFLWGHNQHTWSALIAMLRLTQQQRLHPLLLLGSLDLLYAFLGKWGLFIVLIGLKRLLIFDNWNKESMEIDDGSHPEEWFLIFSKLMYNPFYVPSYFIYSHFQSKVRCICAPWLNLLSRLCSWMFEIFHLATTTVTLNLPNSSVMYL